MQQHTCHVVSNQNAIQVCITKAPANASSANMTHSLATTALDSRRRRPQLKSGTQDWGQQVMGGGLAAEAPAGEGLGRASADLVMEQ